MRGPRRWKNSMSRWPSRHTQIGPPALIETTAGGRPGMWEDIRNAMADELDAWTKEVEKLNVTLALKAHSDRTAGADRNHRRRAARHVGRHQKCDGRRTRCVDQGGGKTQCHAGPQGTLRSDRRR